jgi:hypothetical protein
VGLRTDPGRVVISRRIEAGLRVQARHPEWPLSECIRFARDQADEYAADARLAALGASDE